MIKSPLFIPFICCCMCVMISSANEESRYLNRILLVFQEENHWFQASLIYLQKQKQINPFYKQYEQSAIIETKSTEKVFEIIDRIINRLTEKEIQENELVIYLIRTFNSNSIFSLDDEEIEIEICKRFAEIPQRLKINQIEISEHDKGRMQWFQTNFILRNQIMSKSDESQIIVAYMSKHYIHFYWANLFNPNDRCSSQLSQQSKTLLLGTHELMQLLQPYTECGEIDSNVSPNIVDFCNERLKQGTEYYFNEDFILSDFDNTQIYFERKIATTQNQFHNAVLTSFIDYLISKFLPKAVIKTINTRSFFEPEGYLLQEEFPCTFE